MHNSLGFIFALIFFLPLSSARAEFAGTPTAIELMESGLKATESLADFISSHPCELGLKNALLTSCEKPLSASDLRVFKLILFSLENWRFQAFETVIPNYDVLKGLPAELQLGQRLSVTRKMRFNPFTFESEPYLNIVYSPFDPESQDFIQKVRITTATTLQLYDSFFKIAQHLAHAQKLKSIIQSDMPEEGRILSRTYSLAMDRSRLDHVENMLRFLRKEKKLRGSALLSQSEAYFEQFIHQSWVGTQLLKDSQSFKIRSFFFLTGQVAETLFFDQIETIVGKLSALFGNTVGQIQFRSGKLKPLSKNPELMSSMKASLKPLDVFLEKTPFRLTDRFIPGYYGHVAIWLGTFKDLDALTIQYAGRVIPFLSHPDVLPHLGKIISTQTVLEALREPGVTLNTFEHFLDIDDLLVLRPQPMSESDHTEHLLRAFQQVGKPYDFSFDVETERAIVCSELAYTVFVNETWPTSKSFGRYTMSPDHVAQKGVRGSFDPILMYLDGKKVDSDLKTELSGVLDQVGYSYFLE
jgi:hypothetical protein